MYLTSTEIPKGGSIPVIGLGYNMKCKWVVTPGILTQEGDNYILLSGGIRMRVAADDLGDYMLDTKENRAELKALCNDKNG